MSQYQVNLKTAAIHALLKAEGLEPAKLIRQGKDGVFEWRDYPHGLRVKDVVAWFNMRLPQITIISAGTVLNPHNDPHAIDGRMLFRIRFAFPLFDNDGAKPTAPDFQLVCRHCNALYSFGALAPYSYGRHCRLVCVVCESDDVRPVDPAFALSCGYISSDAMRAGMDAYGAGRPRKLNMFTRRSNKWAEWNIGWDWAQRLAVERAGKQPAGRRAR